MWSLNCVRFVLVFTAFLGIFCDRIEIPAYEYIKRFDRQLNLGQCPNRIVSLPDPTREYCTYPNRPGIPHDKLKHVDFKFNKVITSASELFTSIGLCSEKSVAYFGLLNDGDCVASEIASKLSFKKKHVTRLYLEYYRPRMRVLKPSSDLGVPDEYTNHLNNTYYTENIELGTEEAILVEMQFGKAVQSQKAKTHKMDTQVMSEILGYTGRHIGPTKKVKVIRYSTADERLTSQVFKGTYGLEQAIRYVKQCEDRINDIRRGLNRGIIQSHLKYGFKAYETETKYNYPIALKQVSGLRNEELKHKRNEELKHKLWENVTLLQVNAKRVYVTYKRFRKPCRGTMSKDPKHKFCLLMKQAIRSMKKFVTKIHTQRRDWLQLSLENKEQFVSEGKIHVKLLKTRLLLLKKSLKPFLKSKSRSSTKV